MNYHADIDRLHGHSAHSCPQSHYKMRIEIIIEKRVDGTWRDWDYGLWTDCCDLTGHSHYTSRECTDGTYRMSAFGSIINRDGFQTHFSGAGQSATTFNC